ncbi:MAG: ABC transporter ATP-binding protein [Elusimicrobiales bacterium]|jgi:putative ABC transport system ATP-binding protein|nr:ABC transporter ATP-binding protein [Elusimicrobiales bacterium]
MNEAAPAVLLRGLRKTYPHAENPVEVLKGVDLRLARGETAAVLGPSGSGKSTLLALLGGLDRPTAGEISLFGEPLGGLSEPALARFRAANMGIVFQQFHLMPHMTALENASLPLEIARDPGAEDKARGALASVGLSHREDHLPGELSGGECQRVAIARALVTSPRLLLADEPSGNLDVRTGRQVMDLLFSLVAERRATLLLVTHNPEFAEKCSRRFVLAEGRLADA